MYNAISNNFCSFYQHSLYYVSEASRTTQDFLLPVWKMASKVSTWFLSYFQFHSKERTSSESLKSSSVQSINIKELIEQFDSNMKGIVAGAEKISLDKLFELRKLKRQVHAALKASQENPNYSDYLQIYRDKQKELKTLSQKRAPFQLLYACKKHVELLNRYCHLHQIDSVEVRTVKERVDGKKVNQILIDPEKKKICLLQLEESLMKMTSGQDDRLAFFDQVVFIHGTTTAIFALLPKTEQTLLPVEELLERKWAPLSGELFHGGLDVFSLEQQEGTTAAVKLNENGTYNFSEAIKYSQGYLFHEESYEIKDSELNIKNFRRLNRLLVHLMRGQQWGVDFFSESCQQRVQFRAHIETLIRHNLQEIDNILELADKCQLKEDQSGAAAYAAFDQIFYSFREGKHFGKPLDSTNYKQQFADFLPPEKSFIEKGVSFLKQFSYGQSDNRTSSQETIDSSKKTIKDLFDDFIINNSVSGLIFNLLVIKRDHPQIFQQEIVPFIEGLFQKLKDKIYARLDLCLDVLDHPQSRVLDDKAKTFVREAAPILIFSNSEKVFKPCGYEYRATEPLQLGKHVRVIGVQDENTEERVNQYLTDHGLSGHVQTVKVDLVRKCTLNY